MSPRSNDDDAPTSSGGGAAADSGEGQPGPSLHGLEAGMTNLNHEGGANFTDYLKAQKALQHRVGFDGHGGGSPSRLSAEASANAPLPAEAPSPPGEQRVRMTEDERKAMRRLSLIGRRRTSTVMRRRQSVTEANDGRQRMLHASRADGTEFPCLIGIRTCASGTRIVGYIRDMSGVVSEAGEKMKLDMRVEEAIDRVVDDHAFDGIIVSDNQGIIHRVNETAVEEFGYETKEKMVGLEIDHLIRVVKDHPGRLLESDGEQHLVTLTRTGWISIPLSPPPRSKVQMG
jgi:PAS domain-containing protein